MEDIKYGQLWAGHSELVSNSDVGKYRVSFEGLKNAVDEALRSMQSQPAPGLPILSEPILTDNDIKEWEGEKGQQRTVWVKGEPVIDGFYAVKYTGGGHGGCGFKDGKWNQSLTDNKIVAYLDESGTPPATREDDACDFAEWMRLNCISSQNGWVDTLGKWDTTKGWYELFKQKQKQ